MGTSSVRPGWHGWLAAVIPAAATRFRIHDPDVRSVLAAAGAELVDSSPDVEIAPAEEVRGDAPYALVRLGPSLADRDARAARVAGRLAAFPSTPVGTLRARRALRRRGYASAVVVRWDL